MEEIIRSTRNKKTIIVKEEHTDPSELFSECQSQVIKLNLKLKSFINLQRQKQFERILPSIETLGSEIKELKENIGYQPTVNEKMEERKHLLGVKDKLLEKIKGYSKQMEQLKVRVQMLTIENQELQRQFKENEQLFQGCEPLQAEQDVGSMQLKSINSKRSSTYSQATMNEFKRSLPSIFGRQSKLSRSSLMPPNCQQKWSQIDRLFKKISTLNSNSLAYCLLKQAKKEKNMMKSLLKNYQISQKMGQLICKGEVRQTWRQLSVILSI